MGVHAEAQRLYTWPCIGQAGNSRNGSGVVEEEEKGRRDGGREGRREKKEEGEGGRMESISIHMCVDVREDTQMHV